MQIYMLQDNTSSSGGYTIIGSILVWGLILGTLLSYVPQYYKIYNNKNTNGISEYTILYGIYSCLFNIMGTIQENYSDIRKCREIGNCYERLIPICQLIAPFLCITTLYCFFLKYLTKENITIWSSQYIIYKNAVWCRARLVIISNIFIVLLCFILNTKLSFITINKLGKILNIVSSIFSAIMWIPQIYKTYKLKTDYSLSIIALSIHSFGCFITVVYQVGFANQNLYVVLNYIIGGISEGSIVCMILYYKRNRDKLLTSTYLLSSDNNEYTTL
tara:strand:- start:1333 stop:2154 length:822 start_codon:yes stop_codon:yes gene_type:complete